MKILRKLKGYFKLFKNVSGLFQGSFKIASRVFQKCFKWVSRVNVLEVSHWCLKYHIFQDCFKENAKVFLECFKVLKIKLNFFSRVLKKFFQEASKES